MSCPRKAGHKALKATTMLIDFNCRIGYFIENIQLEGNQLNGTLPSELGLPKTLTFVSLDDNPMSCSGNTTDIAGGTECEEVKLLPCFLQLSSVTVPRADASYMECPLVIRKPHEVAVQDCQGTASSQLVSDRVPAAKSDYVSSSCSLYPGCHLLSFLL